MSEDENIVPPEPIGGARRLATRVALSAYQRASGLPIERQLSELTVSQYGSRAKLEAYRAESLQRHLAYAYEHSPYWHETLKGVGYSEKMPPADVLQRLPIMDKVVYRRERERMVVPGYRGRSMVEESGGTTGEPMEFPMDAVSFARIKSNIFRLWSWAGYHLGEPWVWFMANPRSGVSAKLRDAGFNCTYHSTVRMDPASLEALLRRLSGRRAALIRGYPSTLRRLAEVAHKVGVKDIQTRAVTTTGEMLHPQDRALIESTFRCRIFDTYGGDCFMIAGQCEKGTYHLNDESVWVEIVDDDGNPLPVGETGHIVLSEFHNILTPIFRWRVGDRGRLSADTCSCGRGLSILGALEGRDADLLKLPNGAELCMTFFAPTLKEANGVRQYQVIQEEPDLLRVRLAVEAACDRPTTEARTRERMREASGGTVRMEFEYVDEIPRTRMGKEQVVVSRVAERQRETNEQR